MVFDDAVMHHHNVSETCGCAFTSEGSPWVAQRDEQYPYRHAEDVLPLPEPASDFTEATQAGHMTFRINNGQTAESYPRYSRRRKPSRRISANHVARSRQQFHT